MSKIASTISELGTSFHRAIWRYGIAIWLSFAFYMAANPSAHTWTRAISLLFPYLILEAHHLAREFRHPRPTSLFISDPRYAATNFAVVAVLGAAYWLAMSWHRLSGWPWLMLCLAAVLLAYLIRPRLPRK